MNSILSVCILHQSRTYSISEIHVRKSNTISAVLFLGMPTSYNVYKQITNCIRRYMNTIWDRIYAIGLPQEVVVFFDWIILFCRRCKRVFVLSILHTWQIMQVRDTELGNCILFESYLVCACIDAVTGKYINRRNRWYGDAFLTDDNRYL